MPEKKPLPLWSALASYFIGYLWFCCFCVGFTDTRYANLPTDRLLSWYPLLFSAVFFLWMHFTLRGKEETPEHPFWIACSLLIGIALAFGRCRAVDAWAYLALHGFAAYWVVCRSGLLTDIISGTMLPWDLFETFLILPFGGIFLRIATVLSHLRATLLRIAHREDAGPRDRKSLAASALILLAAVPVFMMVGNLLSQADSVFAGIYEGLGRFFTFSFQMPSWAGDTLFRFAFGLPVGAYLFGLAGSCLRRTEPDINPSLLRSRIQALRFAPMFTLMLVFGSFLALYLLFFSVQAGHLLSAFWGIVPGRLTAAQYAREGFFQLCAVMGINFCLLFAAALVSRIPLRDHKPLCRMAAILMVESIFLAVTAASKLVLYISRFGFTPLRLLSFWGVTVLTAGCLLALAELRKPCRAASKWIWFAAATFTALCFY